MTDKQVENAPGLIVDLDPKHMESYGFRLMMKKIASHTSKQFSICTDGDMTVQIQPVIESFILSGLISVTALYIIILYGPYTNESYCMSHLSAP